MPGLAPETILSDTPKRLEVEYFHALKGKDFGPATYKGLAKNLDGGRDRTAAIHESTITTVSTWMSNPVIATP
jgi:hypothetical protein